MPYLQANNLALEQFIDLIRRYHGQSIQDSQSQPLLLAFSPAQAAFNALVFDEPFLKVTDQGRIFSPEGELNWRRIGGNMRTVYLGEVAPPEGLEDRSSELVGLEKDNSEIVLWGERTETKNEWIEQQVPHRFQYPISTTQHARGRAAIVVEHWNDEFGFARFSRYHSLKEIRG